MTEAEVLEVIDRIVAKEQRALLSETRMSFEDYSSAHGRFAGALKVRKDFPHIARQLFNEED
jgi:hypothetical protein